ncbi:MAG: DMT family transporter [Pseudomonadota bacterium]
MAAAVLLMVVAMSLIPIGDTAGKLLAEEHGFSSVFIGWARFSLGALAALPFLVINMRQLGSLRDWRIHLRGLFLTLGVVCIVTALTTEDIGTVFGAFFVGPILSYVLSVLLLGERVSRLRSMLLVMGFLGVLLVSKPGFGMTYGLGFAVLAGVFYGFYLTSSRWLAGAAPTGLLLLSQLVVGSLLLSPVVIVNWPGPQEWPIGLLLISGMASFLGNLLLLVAYRFAPATALAPFVYFQLVAATALGVLVWGQWPDPLALAGLGLLLGSGLGSLAIRNPA